MFTSTDPFGPLAAWMSDALAGRANAADPYFANGDLPDAMQVATVGPDGRPSLRTVHLKEHGPDGLVFYTNVESRKGRELRGNDRVALLLHWPRLQRQVIAEAVAERVSDADAEAAWVRRPRGSHVAGWASSQSAPLPSREELDQRVAEVERRFAGVPVPPPPTWGGFRCRPDRVEFWQGRPDRLHERCVFTLVEGGWVRSTLYP